MLRKILIPPEIGCLDLFSLSRYSEQCCRFVEAGYVLGLLPAVNVGRDIDNEHIFLPDEVTLLFGDELRADERILRVVVVPEPVDHVAYADRRLKRKIVIFAVV